MELHGIFVPITTPMAADGDALALDRLKGNLDWYNKTGLAGYVVCGSTGEAILLTWNETERLFAAVAEHSSKEKLLVAGTGVESTTETIMRTRRAAELGYAAALVRTPHYYKPAMTHVALLDYFREVADASSIPVLVYSIPQFTGVETPPELVAMLAEHPNIIGIKDSWGKLAVVEGILKAAPKRFQTLVGSAGILDPSLRMGAVGAILGIACVAPDLCVELYQSARGGQSAKADEIQKKLSPVSLKIVSELGVAGVKYALERLGMYGGPARRPLLPLTSDQQNSVKTLLASLQATAAR